MGGFNFSSDNFLLKLLGQQVAMDNQVNNMRLSSSPPSKAATDGDQQNRAGGGTNNNSNNARFGNNVKNHQFMNMSVNANNSLVRILVVANLCPLFL